MPKISCVMPARNAEKTIRKSINSIISQTISDWELIIVDDHSKSRTKLKKIIDSYMDQRLKYYRLEDENGTCIAAARNFGNMMAKAPIIAVMDSDDECMPDRFLETLKAFEIHGCDVFYSDIVNFDLKARKEVDRGKDYRVRELQLEEFKTHNFIPHATVAYTKDLAVMYPYNSFFRLGEDYDLLMRLAATDHKFYFCNQKLLKYNYMTGKYSSLKYDYVGILKSISKNY